MLRPVENGLQIALLGAPTVQIAGEPVRVSPRKAVALLAYLALEGVQQRDTLATLFWPESDQKRARANLRYLLWSLRRTLGAEWVDTSGESVTLADHDNLLVDVVEFRRDAQRWRSHEHADEALCAECVSSLRAAAELYRGDFMLGFTLADCPAFDDWQFQRTDALRRELASVLQALTSHESATGAYDEAIEHARRWVHLDPLHEPAQKALIELYALSDQQAAALRQYDTYHNLLRAELDVEPSSQIREVYEAIRKRTLPRAVPGKVVRSIVESDSGDLSDTRGAEGSPTPFVRERHNLPALTVRLLGRDHDAAAVLSLIVDDDVRLVTLTGPGGVGKTQLALHVAHRALLGEFTHVYFCALASLSDPQRVAAVIAQELAIRDGQGVSDEERVARFLAPRSALLVLDNFEHVLEAAPLVARLLQICDPLTVLVTSRFSLRLSLEHEYAVAPLAVAGVVAASLKGDESLSPAVRLFLFHARRVRPGIRFSDDDLSTIAAICARVDGLPLAIELVAVQSRLFAPQVLFDRLNSVGGSIFSHLAGGSRDIPERHRALDLTIGWSYDLLTEDERALLLLLAVFAGGATLEAVARVSESCGLAERFDIVDTLFSLIDKSFVTPEDQFDGHPRFHMLQTVREFCLERLTASGEMARLREVHATYYLELAIRAEVNLVGPEEVTWLDQLDTDIDNLRAALTWTTEAPARMEQGLRAAAALHDFWVDRNHVREGWQWLTQQLDLDGTSHALTAADALLVSAYLEGLFEQDWVRHRGQMYRALHIFGEHNDMRRLARAHLLLSLRWFYAQSLIDLDKARQHARDSVRCSELSGAHAIRADALGALGILEYTVDNYETAELYLTEGLTLFQEIESQRGILGLTFHLGRVQFQMGRLAEAEELCRRVLELAIDNRADVWASNIYYWFARIAYEREQYVDAQAALDAYQQISSDLEVQGFATEVNFYSYQGLLNCQQGALPTAHANLQLALEATEHFEPGIGFVLACYALFAVKLGEAVLGLQLIRAGWSVREAHFGRALPLSEQRMFGKIQEEAMEGLSTRVESLIALHRNFSADEAFALVDEMLQRHGFS